MGGWHGGDLWQQQRSPKSIVCIVWGVIHRTILPSKIWKFSPKIVEDQPLKTPEMMDGKEQEKKTGKQKPLTKKKITWSEVVRNGTGSDGSCAHSLKTIPS